MRGHHGLEGVVTTSLADMNQRAGFHQSLVCTDDGLLVAEAGVGALRADELAGFTSLFDTIVLRAERDLGARQVDEVTVLDPGLGRIVVRRLPIASERRLFLVLVAPPRASWRRVTGEVGRELAGALDALAREVA